MGVLKAWDGTDWRKVGCGTGGAAGIADDFNRTDGATLVADRSDGGLWTVEGADWELSSGRLIRTTNGAGTPIADRWVYGDYGFDLTVTVVTKFNFQFLDGGMGWYVATDGAGAAGFSVVYDANFPRMELVDLGTNTDIASPVAAPSPDGTERTMTITYDYSSGAITVDIDGTGYFSATSPSLYTGSGLGLYSFRDYATYHCYYDDVAVTGTGGAVPGRLRLWTGTGWVREACDDDIATPGDFTIQSNRCAGSSAAHAQFAYTDVGSSDFTIDVDWPAVLSGSTAGVLVHYVDSTHYYTCTRDGVYDSGTLVFAYTGGATFGAGDHMKVTWASSVLTVYKNGVDVRHITFTGGGTQLSSHLNGFYCNADGTTRWDNWAATGCTTPSSDAFTGSNGDPIDPDLWTVSGYVAAPARHPLKVKVASGGDALFSDDFNRADGALGSGWLASGWLIDTNAAAPTAGGGLGLHDVGQQYVDVTWNFADMTNDDRLYFASDSNGTHAAVINRFGFARIDPGGNTQLDFATPIPTTATRVRVILQPDAGATGTIEVYVDDVLWYGPFSGHGVLPDPTRTYCGMWSGVFLDTTLRIDDMTVSAVEDVWTTVACMVPV